MNGLTASGFYVTVFNLLEKLKVEKVVDVVWSVLTARWTHPHIINSREQLKFIADLAKRFIEEFDNYCNFN